MVLLPLFLFRGKVSYLRCQLPEALKVYTEAAILAKDQREIEHVVLYEKGESTVSLCPSHFPVMDNSVFP